MPPALQEKQAKEAAAAAASGNKGPKQTSGELRVAKGAWPRCVRRPCPQAEGRLPTAACVWPRLALARAPAVVLADAALTKRRCFALRSWQADLSELNLGKSTSIVFPDGKDKLLRFNITLRPEEGLYRGGAFTFTFVVPPVYPHEPPKVKCITKVYHPNIDLDGNVCLNILREDWKPVLSISSCIFGLHHLVLDPNHDDPLNKEAAEVLRDYPRQFEANVRRSVAGGFVGA